MRLKWLQAVVIGGAVLLAAGLCLGLASGAIAGGALSDSTGSTDTSTASTTYACCVSPNVAIPAQVAIKRTYRRPLAGRLFKAPVIVAHMIPPGEFSASCGQATVRGAPVTGHQHFSSQTDSQEYESQQVVCVWRIPRNAHGRLLVVGIRASVALSSPNVGGQTAGPKRLSWRVRR